MASRKQYYENETEEITPYCPLAYGAIVWWIRIARWIFKYICAAASTVRADSNSVDGTRARAMTTFADYRIYSCLTLPLTCILIHFSNYRKGSQISKKIFIKVYWSLFKIFVTYIKLNILFSRFENWKFILNVIGQLIEGNFDWEFNQVIICTEVVNWSLIMHLHIYVILNRTLDWKPCANLKNCLHRIYSSENEQNGNVNGAWEYNL